MRYASVHAAVPVKGAAAVAGVPGAYMGAAAGNEGCGCSQARLCGVSVAWERVRNDTSYEGGG